MLCSFWGLFWWPRHYQSPCPSSCTGTVNKCIFPFFFVTARHLTWWANENQRLIMLHKQLPKLSKCWREAHSSCECKESSVQEGKRPRAFFTAAVIGMWHEGTGSRLSLEATAAILPHLLESLLLLHAKGKQERWLLLDPLGKAPFSPL